MFVSSYSTYINDVNSKKIKQNTQKVEEKSNVNFSLTTPENQEILTSKVDIKTPINYISNYKSFANKQKLQYQQDIDDRTKELQEKPVEKFSKINTLANAKVSYEVNSKMFSLLKVPQPPIGQSKKEEHIPTKLQQKMVNTYIDNENYYKITA